MLPSTRKAVHLLLVHGYLTDVAPAAHSYWDNSSLMMWNRQHPQRIRRLGIHSTTQIRKPTITETAVPKLIYSHCPYTQFII